MKRALISFILAMAATPAGAHITASPGSAPAGASLPVSFLVAHGCDGAATTVVRVEIPAGATSVRPRPKPGWTLTLDYEGGRATPGARVQAVTWRGLLPDSQYDEFSILMKLPSNEGPAYFPTVQNCGRTVEQWTEMPASPGEALTHPAPAVLVGPPARTADSMAGM